MRRQLFFIFALLTVSVSFAQLPPVAQALYDECYNRDTLQGQFATNHGVQVSATADGNSFYLKWFPTGSNPATTPLVVTLHGSNGNSFNEFFNWYAEAQLHGCGIIALQWFRGAAAIPPNDYFSDPDIYLYIDSALTEINYPSGKAFLHGFSRGAARSYAIDFLDTHGGNNYFCTILSNSGGASPSYPLYAQIDSGNFGSNVFAGMQWALFCGGQDTNVNESGCIGMSNTETWLQSQGASVGIFIQDSALGHDGFHLVPAYIDSVLDYYLSCFNGTLTVNDGDDRSSLDVFPNPFTDHISLSMRNENITQARYVLRNIFGQIVWEQKENDLGSNFRKTVNLNFLSKGIYLLEIKIDEQIIQKRIFKN